MTTRHTGHTKRLAAPKKYPLLRKETKYTVKMSPGAHSMTTGVPLLLIFRDLLKYVNNRRELKALLNSSKVNIDGRAVKDVKLPIGLMDIISLPSTKENFRLFYNTKGKIFLAKIKEAESKLKLCKVLNKMLLRNQKIQLNLHDGRNIIVTDKTYKTGDSVLIEVPSQQIKKHIVMDKGVKVFILDGKHIGELATLKDFKPQPGSQADRVLLTTESGDTFETLKRYIFVLGKEKPEIEFKGE